MPPPRKDPTARRLRVLMLTEGTYPFHWGGVSTWCHLLMRDLPNIDFDLLSLAAEPGLESQFALPGNVVSFRTIPLWGVREMLENRPDLTFAELNNRKERTSNEAIAYLFVPIFQNFLHELLTGQSGPQAMAQTIHAMHRFFLLYDFDTAMRSHEVWQAFVGVMQETFPTVAAEFGYPDARYYLSDLTAAMQWLYHWFFPLGAPLPETDVIHAAMAGICTLIAVAIKYEHGAAYMLTEHGIYLRERYLAEAASAQSFFLKVFSLCFARRMTEVTYALADQISPCCDYNQRWELRNGAKPEQIRTIYYGVDSDTFAPLAKPFGDPPVVVWVGRIDPLKDLLTLIRAAGVVHRARPDIQFRLFGSAPAGNEAYLQQCLDLRSELGLETTVDFAGFRSNVASAFNEGDVVVLSSISEAFPFVILEAMLCEKPVVATGVGGIPEQLAGCGYALEPRNPEAMAEAILTLMGDPELCVSLGKAARAKAIREFTVRQSGLAHEASYRRVLKRLQMDRARALGQAQNDGEPMHRNGTILRRQQPDRPSELAIHGVGQVAAKALPNALALAAPLLYADSYRPEIQQSQGNSAIALPENHSFVRKNGFGSGGSQSNYPVGNGNGHSVAQKNNNYERVNNQRNHRPNGQLASPVGGGKNRPEISSEVAALAAEVARRDRAPIDALEITAIIESLGITDEVASQRYFAKDAFDLGEIVYDQLRANGDLTQLLDPLAKPALTTFGEMVGDLTRGFWALLPAAVLLLCIFAYSKSGEWSNNLVLAFSAGMTSSMLVTNGFIQALSRRTSIYLSLGKTEAAGRFLWQGTTLVLGSLVIGGLIADLVMEQFGLLNGSERRIFLLAFLGLSALWMAAGGLSLVQKSERLGVAMVSGLAIGILVDRLAAPYTNLHLSLASLAGYVTTMLMIGLALRRGYSSKNKQSSKKVAEPAKPSIAYLVYEAAPYFKYGFLYMTFILLPHILGWLGTLGVEQVRSWAVTSVELGLTASMPPIILATGLAEHTLRRFWRQSVHLQTLIAGNSLHRYQDRLIEFYWRHGLIYMATLTVLSLLTQLIFRGLIQTGMMQQWMPIAATDELLLLFDAGLIAYGLLGFGLFSCMFCITVGAPQFAMHAVKWGLVATLLIGVPFSTIHYSYSVIGFIAGGAAFVYVAWKNCIHVLEDCDYHFAMTL